MNEVRGLTVSHTHPILEDYSKRHSEKAQNYAVTLSVVVAVVAFAAFTAFWIIGTQPVYTGIPKVIETPWFKKVTFYIPNENHGRNLLIGLIGSLFSPFILYPITYFTFYYFYGTRHLNYIKNLETELPTDKNTLLNTTQIPLFLKSVDTKARIEFIAKMNFQQLNEARKLLKESDFEDAIKDVRSEDHHLWRTILELKKANLSAERLENYINNPAIKMLLNARLDVWAAIVDLYPDTLGIIQEKPANPGKFIEIQVGTQTKKYSEHILSKSEHLRRVEQDRKGQVLILQEDEGIFEYFDFLAGEKPKQTLEELLDILPYASLFCDCETLQLIEAIYRHHQSSMSDEERKEIEAYLLPLKPESRVSVSEYT